FHAAYSLPVGRTRLAGRSPHDSAHHLDAHRLHELPRTGREQRHSHNAPLAAKLPAMSRLVGYARSTPRSYLSRRAMTQSPSPIPLPELHQAELDATTVEQLFTDIAQCAQVVEVRHKYGSRRRVGAPSHATLE